MQPVPHFSQPLLCGVRGLKILFHLFFQHIFPESICTQEKGMHARFKRLRMDLRSRCISRLSKRLDKRRTVFAGADLRLCDLAQHHGDLGCAVILRLKDKPAVKEVVEPRLPDMCPHGTFRIHHQTDKRRFHLLLRRL